MKTGLAWQDDALCAQVGTEMFFPEKGGSVREGKMICASCPVREQCLKYALDNEERFGIWGGASERERRRMRRRGGFIVLPGGGEADPAEEDTWGDEEEAA